MAQATLNTGGTLRGVNDLFIGPSSHTSARYTIRVGGRTENHSSSGVIFSDGMENDYLRFNAGTEAVIDVADQSGHLVT